MPSLHVEDRRALASQRVDAELTPLVGAGLFYEGPVVGIDEAELPVVVEDSLAPLSAEVSEAHHEIVLELLGEDIETPLKLVVDPLSHDEVLVGRLDIGLIENDHAEVHQADHHIVVQLQG